MLKTLRFFWTVFHLIRITLETSFATLIEVPFLKKDRNRINRRLMRWSGKLLKTVGCTYQVEWSEAIEWQEGRAYMLMCNHTSNFDIPLAVNAFWDRNIRMLAKRELFRIPIWGRAMTRAEILSIDRNDKAQAAKDLEVAKRKMEDGIMLWVAPEGTRSRTGKLLPFKMGGFKMALDMEAIVIPMAISGAFEIMPAGKVAFTYGVQATIKMGHPLDTRIVKDRKELAKEVRRQMLELSGAGEETGEVPAE